MVNKVSQVERHYAQTSRRRTHRSRRRRPNQTSMVNVPAYKIRRKQVTEASARGTNIVGRVANQATMLAAWLQVEIMNYYLRLYSRLKLRVAYPSAVGRAYVRTNLVEDRIQVPTYLTT